MYFNNHSVANVLSEPQKEKELWYEFDNYYAWTLDKHPDRRNAIDLVMSWSDQKEFGNLTTQELNEYLNTESSRELVNNVNQLVPYYIEIFDRYFGNDYDRQSNLIDSFQWNAFVDYGLGKLYDPREPRSIGNRKYYVHVMDIGIYGYMRWHRFNWIASILFPQEQNSPSRTGRWLYLDRLVGIAGELHSCSKPRQSSVDGLEPENPHNGENITLNEIQTISGTWSNLFFDDIEKRMSLLEDWNPHAFSPSKNKDFVKVASTKEIQPSHMKEVKVSNESICIANVNGKFFAIGNRCTHQGGRLAGGTLVGYEVECPIHGSKFDVRTGEVTRPPANRPEPTYEVKIDDNSILIKKPKQ